ncbi:MAG TPA: FtsX-like permease family protein [Candidatus Dormibacteraeota bacterium]|nr:FtsX-like permease family protein [Candidatus Dormibacteraeota bacterium]
MPLLLSLAWRNSVSKPGRSLLTVLAVALGVGMILGTALTAAALRVEIQGATAALVGHADAEVFAFGETGFSADMLPAVRGLPEVALAAPLVSKRLNGVVNGQTQAFQMLGVDLATERQLHPLDLDSGSQLSASDAAGVLLDATWARQHGVAVGDSISLFTALGPDVYVVRGLLRDTAFVQSSFGAVVFVPLQTAQRAFRLGARVTQISVAFKPGLKCAAPCDSYPAFRADLRQVATDEYTVRDNHAFYAAQRDPYAEIQPALVFFGVLAVGIGLFLIYNNLAVTVLERRREIGLLRAAGATQAWVRRLFVAQAGLYGAVGSVLGGLVGVGVAALLVVYLRAAGGQPRLQVVVDPLTVLAVVALGVVATLVCGVLPARRAAGLAPLEAIRPQRLYTVERSRRRTTLLAVVALTGAALLLGSVLAAGTTDTGLAGSRLAVAAAGIILLFLGVVGLVPVLIRPLTWLIGRPLALILPGETALARNAVVRRPNRSALTIGGLMVSGALVVSVAGLAQGSLGAGQAWVDSLFVSDYLVVSPVHQDESIRAALGQLQGVSATSPVSFFQLRAGGRALTLAAVDPLDYAARGKLNLAAGDRQTAFTELEESRAVFISRRLAAARNLGLGDHLALTGGAGDLSYRVAAVLDHSLPSPDGGEAALIATGNAKQDFGVSGFNVLQVIPEAGAGPGFPRALADVAQRYGMQLESLDDVRAGVRRGIDSLLLLLTGVGLVGVILGLMSVVTTILLDISESGRELGLLRAVGMTRGQVRRAIVTQSTLLGLSGALAGVLVGLVMIAVMVRAAATTGFEPVYVVPWQVVLAVLAAALLGSVIAVLAPARRAAARSVVVALRFE